MNKENTMVWTWAGWEPAQYYRRLGGFHEQQEGNALWMPEWFETIHSERAAKALSEAGINWVTTHFFKGFGLEVEAEEIEKTRTMIENYHRHGVKVFTYIQYGSLMYETIHEVWGRKDAYGNHDGHPYEYGDQYWRRKPCAHQPGFLPYMMKVVEAAADIGSDGIWLDNLNADGCHCEHCQKAFRQFLSERVKDPWTEMGLKNFDQIRIPRSEQPKDPLFQYWIRFRCEETEQSLQRLVAHAKTINPDLLFSVNVGIGNEQRNILENGNRWSMLSLVDYTYAENHLLPRWEDGKILSQHFTARVSESLGTRIVPGAGVPLRKVGLYERPETPSAATLERVFAESTFFGGHALGGPWGMRGENGGADPAWLADESLRNTHRKRVEFYSKLELGEDASEIALMYSWEAMGWDEPRSKKAFHAMEQLLLQNQFPFTYILSERMDIPPSIKLIILPHVLPISDEVTEKLKAFVKNGGRILATGRSSLYDEAMRQRKDYALADLFGFSFSNDKEEESLDLLIENLENGCLFAPGEWALDDALQLTNEALVKAITKITPPPVKSPIPCVSCSIRKVAAGHLLLGLIHYGTGLAEGLTLSEDLAERSVKFTTVNGQTVEIQQGIIPAFEASIGVTITPPCN